MPPRRSSTTVTVVGILNLVGGGLGLIVTLFSAIGLMVIYGGGLPPSTAPLDSVAIDTHLRLVRPEYKYVELVGFGVGFLFDAMLIASGIGLLYRQKWARTIALTWAVMSFFSRLLITGYGILVLVPAMKAYVDSTLANVPAAQAAPQKIGAALGGYGVNCVSGLLIAYPIIVFCLLMSKSTQAAFEPASLDDEDHDEDYDDRDRGRLRGRDRDDDRDDDRNDRRRRY